MEHRAVTWASIAQGDHRPLCGQPRLGLEALALIMETPWVISLRPGLELASNAPCRVAEARVIMVIMEPNAEDLPTPLVQAALVAVPWFSEMILDRVHNARLCVGSSAAMEPGLCLTDVGLIALSESEFRLLAQTCPPNTRLIRFDPLRRNRRPVLTDIVQGTQWRRNFGAMAVLTFTDFGSGDVLAMHHPSGFVEDFRAAEEELTIVHL